jgi:hypothetical protein
LWLQNELRAEFADTWTPIAERIGIHLGEVRAAPTEAGAE